MTEREKIAHLLRRFGLGASEAEMEFYVPLGWKGTINHLLAPEKVKESFDAEMSEFANSKGVVNVRVAQGIWHLRLLMTNRPLVEKMTVFWHNHFAVASSKVDNSYAMMNYIDVLRKGCLGGFRPLLEEVSKTPAMIFWLDNNLNVKGKPNENFAREVMELFTLGVGHYTEQDIQEAARAFTGWRYGVNGRRTGSDKTPRRVERFVFDETQHDTGVKTVLGRKGNLSGEDVLDILCDEKQTAIYIATKMWKFFAHPNPDPVVIEKISKKFIDSLLNVRVLVRAIMESDEFYADQVVRRQIKNPVDFVVAPARALGAGQMVGKLIDAGRKTPDIDAKQGVNRTFVRALGPSFAMLQSATAMGMELLNPPDVAGWGHGNQWISSATMVARMKYGDLLFAGGQGATKRNLGADLGGTRGPSLSVPVTAIATPSMSGEALADRLISVFDVPASDEVRNKLRKSGTELLAQSQDLSAAARGLARLICGLPEFQVN